LKSSRQKNRKIKEENAARRLAFPRFFALFFTDFVKTQKKGKKSPCFHKILGTFFPFFMAFLEKICYNG
jgi:hypothetical protein